MNTKTTHEEMMETDPDTVADMLSSSDSLDGFLEWVEKHGEVKNIFDGIYQGEVYRKWFRYFVDESGDSFVSVREAKMGRIIGQATTTIDAIRLLSNNKSTNAEGGQMILDTKKQIHESGEDMSDTPRTDDLSRGNHNVPTWWACQLERELNEAKGALAQAHKDFGHELRDPCGTIWDECDWLQKEVDHANDEWASWKQEAESRGKALAEARKDTERLDWLEQQRDITKTLPIRQEIDAAMEADK